LDWSGRLPREKDTPLNPLKRGLCFRSFLIPSQEGTLLSVVFNSLLEEG